MLLITITTNRRRTSSFTIQELSVIQSRTLGRTLSARSPMIVTARAGRTEEQQGKSEEAERVPERIARSVQEAPDRERVIRSLGKTPSRRKPSLKANRGVAVWSLPIHLGGSAVFRVK
jgi:hypothetical protein